MAKVFFIALHDPLAAGVRALAAFIKQQGHTPHMCFLRSHERVEIPAVTQGTAMAFCDGAILETSIAQSRSLGTEELRLLTQSLNAFQPDILAVSCRSVVSHLVPALFTHIRTYCPQALVISGGFGPSLEAEWYLRCGADVVVRGEGEQALAHICHCIDAGQNWREVLNVTYIEEGRVIRNPLNPLLRRLDSLPPPLWDARSTTLILDDQLVNNKSGFIAGEYHCLTGRGCVGKCSYCSADTWHEMYRTQGIFSPRVRQRSLRHVFEELLWAKTQGATAIRITDDFFVRSIPALKDFFTKYNAEIRLPLRAYVLPEQMEKDNTLFQLATQMMDYYDVGVQSGCEDFNKNVYARFHQPKTLMNILNKCLLQGITVTCQFIGGQPLAPPDVFEKTLDFIARLPFTPRLEPHVMLWDTFFRPIPQSRLITAHDNILPNPYNRQQWLYESLLMHFRIFMGDAEFHQLRQDAYWKQHPDRLQGWYRQTLMRLHYEYIEISARALSGKAVLFWGNGPAYERWKVSFAASMPMGMALGPCARSLTKSAHIDGIKLIHVNEILAQAHNTPVVIFGSRPDVRSRVRALLRVCPEADEHLFTCIELFNEM